MRHATRDDIPKLLEMGKEFVSVIGEISDDESIENTLIMLMDSPDGILLIDKGAMAGAFIYPHFFNVQTMIAQELFWWVNELQRGTGVAMKLMHGLEDWARDKGAKTLIMTAMSGLGDVGKIYESKGYTPRENTYFKDL